jgi:hypothetical protein
MMKFDDTIYSIIESTLKAYIHEQISTNDDVRCAIKRAVREMIQPDIIEKIIKDYIDYSDEYRGIITQLAEEELMKVKVRLLID